MNRLIHARLMFALTIALAIGAVEIGNLVAPRLAEPVISAHSVESSCIPMLPTISVRAADEIPTLPLVLVRPTPAQLAATPSSPAIGLISASASSSSASVSLPHVRLDMPYYSFGKMLPNVIKD